jgi:hypothetical protein
MKIALTLPMMLLLTLTGAPAWTQVAPHSAQDLKPAFPAQTALSDPYVPPERRIAAAPAVASGAALQVQAMRKLQKQFDAAAAPLGGSLSRSQASAAGLGYVAHHFEQIDQDKTGRVSFEQVRQHLQKRAALQP